MILRPFTFKREAYWLLVACLLPLAGILAAVVLPLIFRWFAAAF
jgi:hypothetical protein